MVKWESIKLKILKGRQLLPIQTANVLQDHENRLTALENGDSEEEPAEPVTRDLSFTVNDGENPVQGATVTLREVEKTTGSAGGCTFNEVTDGEHEVTVEAEGYNTATETITVDAEHTSFTITLTVISGEI